MKINEKTTKNEQIEAASAREVSAAHLRDFRKNVIHCSQEELAEKIGVSGLTIGRYERREMSVSNKSADRLAELSGYIREYWLGLTEQKTERAFDDECMLTGLDELEREHVAQQRLSEQRRALLSLCGYSYENLDDEEHILLVFSEDPEDRDAEMLRRGFPHKITNHQSAALSDPVYFSEAELEALTKEVQNVVGYSWYRKIAGA